MSENERFQDRALDGAEFQDCTMARSRFEDIDLSETVFEDVNLSGARFKNVNMTAVWIEDAKIDGLKILGHDIGALIQDCERQAAPKVVDGERPVVMTAEPQIFVVDIESSRQFYVDKLGFNLAFSHGQPPFYAQIIRDGCRLNLRRVCGPVFEAGFRDREADALSATLALDDARPLFDEFQSAGVTFHQPLRTEPWGAHTFIVQDPDCNLIAFAGRAS